MFPSAYPLQETEARGQEQELSEQETQRPTVPYTSLVAMSSVPGGCDQARLDQVSICLCFLGISVPPFWHKYPHPKVNKHANIHGHSKIMPINKVTF